MTAATSDRAALNASIVWTGTGLPPASRTWATSRVDQMRSSARIRTRGPDVSANGLCDVSEEIPRGHDPRRHPSAIDDRDMAETAHCHLVDRDRDRIVVTEDDRVVGHDLPDGARARGPAGDLQDRVAIGED